MLDALGLADGRYSFADLAKAVGRWGLKGGGLALSFEQLKKLRVPVVAYMKHRGQDHFSVVRGVSPAGIVHLADPSLGNRRLKEHQFRAVWETRGEAGAEGKILLIVPKDAAAAPIDHTFFAPPAGWPAAMRTLALDRR